MRLQTVTALVLALTLTVEGDSLSSRVQEIRERHDAVGLVVVVGHSDGSIEAGTSGVRVKGGSDPLCVDDAFHVGSVTKPITATMIGTLVDDGKLDWNTTIAETLAECLTQMNPAYRNVTVAQLLAHEGGLAPFDDDEAFEGLSESGTPREQRLAFACHALSVAPVVAPGEVASYSNAGFAVAAAIAEEVTGESWETLIRERIFDPLGLASAGVGWPGAGGASAPWGHWEQNDAVVPQDPDGVYQLPASIAPAGDLHMSMPDLARLLIDQLRALEGKDALIEPSTASLMHTKRIRGGLGWGIQALGELEPVSVYQGSAGTFVTIVAVVPSIDTVIAVSANDGTDQGAAAAKDALKSLLVAR